MSPRWTRRPEGSTWGDFGADDQLGRLNLLTPQKVLQGIEEVKEGRSFCLSLPLDFPGEAALNPRRHPPRLKPTELKGVPFMNRPLSFVDERNTDILCDDEVTMSLQYSTQWDSFAHVGAWFDADGDGVPEQVYYNGFRAHEHVLGPGDAGVPAGQSSARALGIETFALRPIQGRAVLVDLHAHFGRKRVFVGFAELSEILQQDRVTIEPGDILVFHTGFSQLILEMDRHPRMEVLNDACAVLDGRDQRLLQFVTDSGVAALCADNYAVEGYPAKAGGDGFAGDGQSANARSIGGGRRAALPLHEHCLFKLGVPLGELWWLTELAEYLRSNRRNRFLLTAPPLRLPGAVGSPVTPVATV